MWASCTRTVWVRGGSWPGLGNTPWSGSARSTVYGLGDRAKVNHKQNHIHDRIH